MLGVDPNSPEHNDPDNPLSKVNIMKIVTDVLGANAHLLGPKSSVSMIQTLWNNYDTITSDMRDDFNAQVNEMVDVVHEGFGVRHWYKIFPTHFCYGYYDNEHGGRELVDGCL